MAVNILKRSKGVEDRRGSDCEYGAVDTGDEEQRQGPHRPRKRNPAQGENGAHDEIDQETSAEIDDFLCEQSFIKPGRIHPQYIAEIDDRNQGEDQCKTDIKMPVPVPGIGNGEQKRKDKGNEIKQVDHMMKL